MNEIIIKQIKLRKQYNQDVMHKDQLFYSSRKSCISLKSSYNEPSWAYVQGVDRLLQLFSSLLSEDKTDRFITVLKLSSAHLMGWWHKIYIIFTEIDVTIFLAVNFPVNPSRHKKCSNCANFQTPAQNTPVQSYEPSLHMTQPPTCPCLRFGYILRHCTL